MSETTFSGAAEPPPARSTNDRTSYWFSLAVFTGTTVALAVPLVVLVRGRNAFLRKALSDGAPPPRRHMKSSSTNMVGRIQTGSPSPHSFPSTLESSRAEFSSPKAGELLSAISRVDYSTALYGGKAFGIATGIVVVGGLGLTLGVKAVMGIQDTKEFANRMRVFIWRGLPGLTSRIHRPLDVDVGDEPLLTGVSQPQDLEFDEKWDWERAEKRLQAAYDEGGISAWILTAMREVEVEVKVERARRKMEYDHTTRRDVSSQP